MSEREKMVKTGLFTPGNILSIVKIVQGQILQMTKCPRTNIQKGKMSKDKYYKEQNIQKTNITKDKMSREQIE